jgi:hypothetical protein
MKVISSLEAKEELSANESEKSSDISKQLEDLQAQFAKKTLENQKYQLLFIN